MLTLRTVNSGCVLGYLFSVYLCMLNPLNGHLIVCPCIWKLTCLDPMCKTAFVVLRNGLLGLGELACCGPCLEQRSPWGWMCLESSPKCPWLLPSAFHSDWSTIYNRKCAADKGPPSILSYVYLGHDVHACSKVAEGVVEDMWANWACDCQAGRIFFLGDEWWFYEMIVAFST
jgi:hypothetical protein